MDKTQMSPFTLYSPEDLVLRRNRTLFFEGVAPDWELTDWKIDDYDLLLCLKGEAFYHDSLGTHQILPGKAYLAVPGVSVSAELGDTGEYHVLAQHFTLTLPDGEDALAFLEAPLFGDVASSAMAGEYRRVASNPESHPFLVNDLFRVILWDFLSRLPGPDIPARPKDPLKQKLRELAAWIRENDPNDENLEKRMAREGYAPVYLRDSFRQHFGRTPRQYRTDRKMDRARSLLIQGCSVKETAARTGYSDELYFARVFKNHYGIAPGRFARHVTM